MELLTTKNKEFRRTACTIIDESGEILVMLRYPYAAGLRDYFFLTPLYFLTLITTFPFARPAST